MTTTAQKSHDSAAVARTRQWFQNRAEPVWEIAELFPPQGEWTEDEYLALDTDRRIELARGFLEFLPMPKVAHKLIELFLYHALLAFVQARKLGVAFDSGLKVRLWKGTIRYPDVVFVSREHKDERDEDCYHHADLIMEVVSPSRKDRSRDYTTKKLEYAKAGIREYWIVDPQARLITVLRLEGRKYGVHGEFKSGQRAASAVLAGFEVDVSEALAGFKQ